MIGGSDRRGAAAVRPAKSYRDFNVRFAHYNDADGSFRVWVEGETPGGTMSPNDAAHQTYQAEPFWLDAGSGSGGFIDGLAVRDLEPKSMFALGRLLGDLALPQGKVRALFDKSLALVAQTGAGLRLRLHIDAPALADLPWEFMLVQQTAGNPQDTDFLALRREISIVRTDTVEAAPRALPDRQAAYVVGVLSNPRGQPQLDVGQDKGAIEQAVQGLNQLLQQELIELRWAARPATRTALQQALAHGADIFHFAGHALFDAQRNEASIVLEHEDKTSDVYSGQSLAHALRDGVRLAVLGGCDTGRRDGRNLWSGVAAALTHERIPAVIAHQFQIKDSSAALLTAQLYARVLSGGTVDEALFEARQAIYLTKGLQQRDWGTPVLYLHDATGVLFSMPQPDVQSGAAVSPFINVAINLRNIAGHVTGFKASTMTGGKVEVSVQGEDVLEGGKLTGVEIDTLGGASVSRPAPDNAD